MAFTLPLIGDLADLGLNDFQIGPGNARKIRGYVRTNLGAGDALIDTTNQVTLLGDTPITILSNGTWSVDLLDTSSTDLNVEANTLQYELVVEYTSTGSPAKRVYRSGWFALTEADLELVEDVPMAVFSSLDLDLPSVTPSWRSAFVASMEAIATTSAASATSAAASADAAATIVGLTGEDAAVAFLVEDAGSDTSAALLASFVAVPEFDLRTFLLPAEVFPNDGVLNASTLINRALVEIGALVAADTTDRVFTLNLGAGRFRLNSSIDIVAGQPFADRIKIKGAARWLTVLLPYGTASGVTTAGAAVTGATPLDFFWFRECHFEDFTIDARNQTYPEPSGLQKAFQGGGWYECTWTRVNAIGTTATMFGTDYPVRCTYTDCWAIDAGRGIAQETEPAAAAEMRSGFGIGFGHYDDESVTFIGGGATGCARSGYFFERQDSRDSLRREATITMIGVEASFNGNGITDAGCCGVDLTDSKVTDNAAAGFYNGPNTQAVESGIYARIKGNTFLRNGVGAYFTGSIQTTPADAPVGAAGGYVIEGNRFQDNIGPGVRGKNFLLEAGGLSIRGNQFVRNGGAGVELHRCALPARDLDIVGNKFDGNAGIGLALLVPMNAPRITDNDFFNSDGTDTQLDAIMFHPAEPVTVPRVQRNTWRRHARGLVNADRLDQTLITDNLDATETDDPATAAVYDENLQSKPDSSAATLGAGWAASAAGASSTWLRTSGGTRPSSGTWGAHAIQTRDLGQTNIYASVTLPDSTQGAGANRLRGVAISVSNTEAIIAGADDVSSQFGAPANYAMWKVVAGTPTLLWQSAVPATGGHSVALARESGSTQTTMFIDGIAVHTEDVTDVPPSNYAGVAAASGVAGTSGSTPSARLIRWFRAVSAGDFDIKTGIVRNKATNPSFEVTGGFTSQWGTGGAGTATRENSGANARSGSYSYLLTWTTATTDPVGGGGRISTIEDVTVGKTYTASVWIKSSVARKFRANTTYYNATGATGTSTGSKSGTYVDVLANTWTRLSITTDALPASTVSIRLDVSAASLAAGGTVFAIGDTLRIDDYMVTEGTVLYDHFDGANNGGTWTGTANASASTKELPV